MVGVGKNSDLWFVSAMGEYRRGLRRKGSGIYGIEWKSTTGRW